MRFVVATLIVCASCGARTPLGAPGEPIEAGADAALDSPIELDAPSDAPFNDGAICCEDSQNTESAPDALSGGASVAWQYVPTCNILVKSLELHNRGGAVALRDSNGEQPGVALFQGTLPVPSGPDLDWVATDVQPPVLLQAGHVYWIQEAPGPLSEASSGIAYTYYADGLNGWDGPFNWHFYTSRIHGSCN